MNESQALQLLLKRGRKNAERRRGPLLTAAGGEKSRDDEAPLERRQQIPKHEAFARRPEVEKNPFREVTRHEGRISHPREAHNGTAIDSTMILDL